MATSAANRQLPCNDGVMIVVAGEALVDMIEQPADAPGRAARARDGHDRTPSICFSAHYGGGPFNTAIALGRLGHPVGYAYPLSRDRFGRALATQLCDAGVEHLQPDPSASNTPLALVQVDAGGQAVYRFYRQETADRDISAQQLLDVLTSSCRVFVTGTLAIAEQPDVSILTEVIAKVRARGALICVDPNLRPQAFADKEQYLANVREVLALADIIKASDADLAMLLADTAPEEAATALRQKTNASLVVVTMGHEGALGQTAQTSLAVGAHDLNGGVIDTVGAGDTFLGGLLFGLVRQGIVTAQDLAALEGADLAKILRFANVAAGLNCAYRGCNPPSLAEVEAVLEQAGT